jgi:hypothetical protein
LLKEVLWILKVAPVKAALNVLQHVTENVLCIGSIKLAFQIIKLRYLVREKQNISITRILGDLFGLLTIDGVQIEAFLMIAINLLSKENNHAST